jgi:hypothetical protein
MQTREVKNDDHHDHTEVEVPARGTVHVYGLSAGHQESQNIEAAARDVAGVSKVVSGLAVLSGV